jgi:hypothetical protein
MAKRYKRQRARSSWGRACHPGIPGSDIHSEIINPKDILLSMAEVSSSSPCVRPHSLAIAGSRVPSCMILNRGLTTKVWQGLLLRGSKSLRLREKTLRPIRPSHQFSHAFSGSHPVFAGSFLRSNYLIDESRVRTTLELPMALER